MTRASVVRSFGAFGFPLALVFVGYAVLNLAASLLALPQLPQALGYVVAVAVGATIITQALCVGGTGPGAVPMDETRRHLPPHYKLLLLATLGCVAFWAWDQFIGDAPIRTMFSWSLIGVGSALELAIAARRMSKGDTGTR